MEKQHPARLWAGCRRDRFLLQSVGSPEVPSASLKALLEFPRKIFGDLGSTCEVGDADDLMFGFVFLWVVAEDFLECGDGFVVFLFGDKLAGVSAEEWWLDFWPAEKQT
jgi:hypothetical protein